MPMIRTLAILSLALALGSCAGRPSAVTSAPAPLSANAANEPCVGEMTNKGYEIRCGGWRTASGFVTQASSGVTKDEIGRLLCPNGATWSANGGREQALCDQDVRVVLMDRTATATLVGYAYPSDAAALADAITLATKMDNLPAPFAPSDSPERSVLPSVERALDTARIAAAEQRYLAAEQALLEALPLAGPGSDSTRSILLAELASVLASQGRSTEAGRALAEATSLVGDLPPLVQARIALSDAALRLDQSRPAEALAAAQRAQDLAVSASRQADGEPGPSIERTIGATISPADARYIELVRQSRTAWTTRMDESDSASGLLAYARYVEANARIALGELGEARQLLQDLSLGGTESALEAQIVSALAAEDLAMIDQSGGQAREAANRLAPVLDKLDPRLRGSPIEARLSLRAATLAAGLGDWPRATDLAVRASSIVRAVEVDPGFSAEQVEPLIAMLISRKTATAARSPEIDDALFGLFAAEEGELARRSSALLSARLASGDGADSVRAYQDASRRLRQAESQMSRIVSLGLDDPDSMAPLLEQAAQLQQELDDAERSMRRDAPGYFSLTRDHVDRSAMLDALAASGEAYVKVMPARQGTYFMALTPTGDTSFAVSRASAAEIRSWASGVHASMTLTAARLPPASLDYVSSCALSREVVAPLAALLETTGVKAVAIEPGSALADLPMSGLLVASDQCRAPESASGRKDPSAIYLIDRYAVSVSPSADVYASSVGLASTGTAGRETRFAGFGGFAAINRNDPAQTRPIRDALATSFGSTADACLGGIRAILSAASRRLPGSEVEVQQAGLLFGSDSIVLTGDAFTREAFQQADLSDVSVLTIATHSFFADIDEAGCFAEPGLIATPGADGNFLITLNDLASQRLSADVVVLSACESVRSSDNDLGSAGLSGGGEVLGGLAQGLIFAGARSVVASHWLAADEATRALTTEFYARLAAGEDSRTALMEAQKAIKATPGFEDPIFWSAFSLYGYGGTGN